MESDGFACMPAWLSERLGRVVKIACLWHFSMQKLGALKTRRQHRSRLEELSNRQKILWGYVFACLRIFKVEVCKDRIVQFHNKGIWQFRMACHPVPPLLIPVEPCFRDPCVFFTNVYVRSWPLMSIGLNAEGWFWGFSSGGIVSAIAHRGRCRGRACRWCSFSVHRVNSGSLGFGFVLLLPARCKVSYWDFSESQFRPWVWFSFVIVHLPRILRRDSLAKVKVVFKTSPVPLTYALQKLAASVNWYINWVL